MAKPKLRRTLYIGLGGTGIKVIKEVKKNFLNNSASSLPSMVKFLCIDSNKGDLNGVPIEGEERLGTLEKIHMTVDEPVATLHAGGAIYDWIPKSNRDSVIDIEGNGAGQVRSNGRFIIEDVERKHETLSRRLTQLFSNLTSVTAEDENYDILSATNIDVHLVFSLAGGTGSGMFLSVANLVRRYIPHANLMAYAFSPQFFTSVGVNWNITHNAYGALLELDYHMHGGKGKYTNVDRNITKKLFDSVMYIDKYTYTKSHLEDAFTYDFDEVKVIVAHALYLSAGEIGTNALSIVDNLRTAMNSGGYDMECPNGIKGAWISSIGVSEIFCNPQADIEFKTIESAGNILKDLLDGERAGLTVTETNNWIGELNLDESQGDKDGNYLINRMLRPESFKTPKSQSKITVYDSGTYDDSDFIKINDTVINSLKDSPAKVAEEKRKLILQKVKEELFPTSGVKTIGVKKLIQILSGLRSDILNSKKVLQGEVEEFSSKQENTDTIIKQSTENIAHERSRNRFVRDNDAIEDAKDEIRKQRVEHYKYQLEIDRRTSAIEVYDILDKFLESYTHENTGFLSQLKSNLESGIEKLEEKANKDFSSKVLSRESTSIDLTSRANLLITASTEKHPIVDWNKFFSELEYASIENLAPKADWDTTAVSIFNSHQSSDAAEPIIVRIMNTYSKEERIQKYKDLINRARPLMEISSFGERINPSDFIFVSYPCNLSTDKDKSDKMLAKFKIEFEEALGSDKFEVIPQKDNNKILMYRQMGVIPPFYIQGISYKKNTLSNPESCEALYLKYISKAGNRRKVKPFTDSYFEDAYEKGGHSFDSEYGIYVSKLDLWVDCFILGLIERKDDLYRIEYNKGEIELMPPFKAWKNLGTTRTEAYEAFEQSDNEFVSYLKEKREQLLLNTEVSAQRHKFYGVGENKVALYMKSSLLDFESEEFKNPNVQDLIRKECDFLRQNQ